MRPPDGDATWSEPTVFPLVQGFAKQALFADLLVLMSHWARTRGPAARPQIA